MEFDVYSALAAAKIGQLDEWIQTYLRTGDWANPGLANGLQLQKRWWLGPVVVNIGDLVRVCGPETWMEYRIPLQSWELKISKLMTRITDVRAIPPLIVEYRSGDLSLRDGNHRLEAMQRKGWPRCWVIIWHNTEEDYQRDLYRQLEE